MITNENKYTYATYLREKARGIVHTPEWKAKMDWLGQDIAVQREHDLEAQILRYKLKGYIVEQMPDGGFICTPPKRSRWLTWRGRHVLY